MKSDNMPPRGWSASGGKSDSMPPRGWSASGGKSDFPEGVLRPDHAGYPVRVAQALKHLPELYFRGNAELLSCQTMLAVVGSRRPSFQAEKNLDRILRPLAGAPLTIVSGLAIGLDACGHEAALEGGLPTIAVVGSPVAAHEAIENSRTGSFPRGDCSYPLSPKARLSQNGIFPGGTKLLPHCLTPFSSPRQKNYRAPSEPLVSLLISAATCSLYRVTSRIRSMPAATPSCKQARILFFRVKISSPS